MADVPTSPPTSPTSAAGLTWRQRAWRWEARSAPYVYIAPFFVIFAIVGLFPLLYTAYVSTRDYSLVRGDLGSAGLENYSYILTQPRTGLALRNTLSIFLLSSIPQIVMAIGIAYLLHANLRGRTLWRMGVLLPYVVAPVAVSLIFGQLFADQSGTVNAVLTNLGLPAIGWHRDSLASHLAIATMVNFRWTGYTTLIVLAAMQAIPNDLVEAATVDGASRWQSFWHVTLPALRPTLVFVVITSTIGGLQIFDEPRLYDVGGLGGSDRQWMTMTMYLYELGWGSQRDLGRASAVAWLLFLLVVLIALANFALTRRIASDDPTRTPRARRRAS